MPDSWDDDTTATGMEELTGRVAEGARASATLTVLTGAATGQTCKVKSVVTIGRGTEANFRIQDDGISRLHARVKYDDGKAFVEDLASRNGTLVNGTRITEPRELHDGDKLQIGRATVLRFSFQDELDDSYHENLLSSALRDGLTKLFNKRYFLDRLDSELKFALRHETSLSLLMLDIDHFKRVNDTYGHLAGDLVLTQLATVLAKAVRNEDVVARFGGEELAVVLRAIGLDAAMQLAERLRRLIERTVVPFRGVDLKVTVSIGAAGVPACSCKTVEQFVEAADRALYEAKRAGRNRVCR